MRQVRLQTWALNHSAIEIAKQCGVSRQAVHKSISDNKEIYLTVDDGQIVLAQEVKPRKSIWKFKDKQNKQTV